MKKAAAISSVLDVPGLPATPFGATSSPSITVPAGKHLVVETVSVQVDVTPLGSQLEAFVNYTCGGNSAQLFVPLTFAYGQTGNQFDTYVALQAVRLYVDPGTTVTVTTFTPTGSTGTLFLTLSGYLI